MKCTACESGLLSPAYLDVMLACHTCDQCGGSLLKMVDYLHWKDRQGDFSPESPKDVVVSAEESPRALLCPVTGGLMTKYRISADTDHRLDLSVAINAVWIDKGEWDLLKADGLSLQVNRIFTNHWQRAIHDAESKETMQELYQRRFGEHYAELKKIRKSLALMPNKHEAMAYLSADDPYQP